ncbi:four helix bundle protein [Empedobacter tilapiae]|uniref:Four helix bundle protein n=1 Tax=Empedobacter tilapiae TaxID=2491114 RepID=A0A4Z1BXM2_9FLAO|nr:four helix bundle protein [Empedobacter tilapiae]TGN29736.1 four helix bundle protein [Empedobacter tilapiae]
MRSYRNLDIWQKSLEILRLVYDLSNKFPESEKYGLTVQIKRAVVSILSNIAEGSGRNSNQQMINFLSISKGSAFEVEAQLIIAFELNYITESELNEALELIDHYCRMNQNFQNYLIKKNNGTK